VIQENEIFLLQKLQEFAPSQMQDYKGFFYRILYFFEFKAKNNFYSQEIVDFLKSELGKQRQSEKPELYSNIIHAIYSIE